MNVFVTAGTQFPFSRLDEVVNALVTIHPDWSVTYQSGPDSNVEVLSKLPLHKVSDLFTSDDFRFYFDSADLVITHAGMGNVITCLEKGKPFVMFPRLSKYGEHRNNHQVDSANAISKIYSIPTFFSVSELVRELPEIIQTLNSFTCSEDELSLERKKFAAGLNDLLLSL
ncbi:glycosyltransferase [Oceanisphaera ostreae]|uniref:Glycosyltransferase n=1 Tax=Oceanisphaera ostreae TaxID=914151 RepID=A0ABW3KFW7_9GAMM